MITFLIGENSFELTQARRQIEAAFDGDVQHIEGTTIELSQLPDLLMGATLFAAKRLVVIRELSENKTVWTALPEWLDRIGDDIHLVVIEPKPDKRTKTFKELKKQATVQEYELWGERDIARAETWATNEAQSIGITFDRGAAQELVARVGVDQWRLHNALQKLAVISPVTVTVIREIIDANPSENVFNLFDAALRGDTGRLSEMLKTLEQTDDPYMLFGLLSSQAFQLAALAVGDASPNEIAKDIGAHPFALSKLAPHAKRQGKVGAGRIIAAFANADDRLKSGPSDPWLVLRQALIAVAQD